MAEGRIKTQETEILIHLVISLIDEKDYPAA